MKQLEVPKGVTDISQLVLNDKQAQFLANYTTNGFILHQAALKTGISKNQFYIWKANYPHFAKAMELLRDQFFDVIEDQYKKLVTDGNVPAILFGMKTLGKDKGYSERVEQHITGQVEHSAINVEKMRQIYLESQEKEVVDVETTES